MARGVLEVGLTGGIASGKSTVAHRFVELGAFLIDADAIAHRLLEPGGGAYDSIIERFGRGVLDDEGRIVRARLAQLVFGDAQALAELNAIVHPRVRAEARRLFDACAREGLAPIAIYDAALLVETGAHEGLDRLVVVSCSRETQIRRLHDRDGLPRHEAEKRIDAQAPLDEKVALADYVIDTDGPLAATLEETDSVWADLLDQPP